MPHKFLEEFQDGESVNEVFLLVDKQLRANRNADLYLLATLRDRTGQINGMMWNVTEDAVSHVQSGDLVRVKGKMQLYQGGLQTILNYIAPVAADDYDLNDFHLGTSKNVDLLLNTLTELLKSISDDPLRIVMENFLNDEDLMAAFKMAPAGVKVHHAYHGGLLEHVVNMMEVVDRTSVLYPQVDRDLLLCGAFLHDLGKVREMSFEATFTYSDEGQMLGHMLIACEILSDKIREYEQASGEQFPDETAWRLKHMILSHHGTAAAGSSKVPMTPEAIALHYIDSMDAKIHEFSQTIDADPNGDSKWTPYCPRLGRKLFKG